MNKVILATGFVINVIALLTVVIRVSSVIFDLKRRLDLAERELYNKLEILHKDIDAKVTKVERQLDSLNHSIEMDELQVTELSRTLSALRNSAASDNQLIKAEVTNMVTELRGTVASNNKNIRSIENFLQKKFDEFEPRDY